MDDDRDVEQLRAEIKRLLAVVLEAEALHAEEVTGLIRALDTRDIIGQAKGVIMSSLGCTADDAYDLLVEQSLRENRRLYDVAAEIAAKTARLH